LSTNGPNFFSIWLIFYQVNDDAIVFLRVRYGVMDLEVLELES